MSSAFALESIAGWWDLVDRRATLTPDSRLFFDPQGRELSCLDYRECAEETAAGLWELGVRPGMTVSWQLPTTLEAVVLLAAFTRLGVVQNLLMPVLREAEIGPIFERLRPHFFITPKVFRGYDHEALGYKITGEYGGQVIACDLADGRTELALPQADPALIAHIRPPENRAAPRWVFFTSGTTGTPKGVKHTDASVIASSGGSVTRLCVTDEDVLSLAYPVTHIGGPGLLAAALRTGASVVLVAIFDAKRTPHELSAAKVTMLGSAAPFFHAYLAAQEAHGSEKLFPHLRLSVNGGAAAPADLYARVPVELGGKGLFNGYGMTECPVTGYAQFDDHPEELLATYSGLPGPGVQVRAVDADGRDRPPGVEGELRLRGPQLFAGYVDSSQDAAALDDKGFFRTGDLGVVNADGSYHVTGRIKDIIIRNAENISAPQMEQVLIAHPQIADVAIVGIPDRRTGERCCAFVVLTADTGALELTDIIEFCKSSGVASYKIPEQLEIIDILPRTSMGKVLKHKLRDLVTSTAG